MKIIVIPDAHAHPKYGNERFRWLGEFIADEQPDVLVNIGDFCDMPSLNSHATPLAKRDKLVRADLEAAAEAMELLEEPTKRRKKGMPRRIWTEGNHDRYLSRFAEEHPEFEGMVGSSLLPAKGWELYPYQQEVIVEDIVFAHNFPTGTSGKPAGGMAVAKSLMKKWHMSFVVGHSHTFDYYEEAKPNGSRLFGVNVGCYTHEAYREGWNRATFRLWWRGVVVLDNVENGFADLRKVSQDALKKRYG